MAKWRFEKEGKPLLQANESPASFKKRVKAWEKRTGREYVPMQLGAEQKILSGKTTIGGWGNQTDYFSNDSLVNEQNIKAAMGMGYVDPNAVSPEWKEPATYARSIERDKEIDQMKADGETEYDQGSVQYAVDEYNKRQEEEKAQLEAWREEAGYPGVKGGDADYGQWRGTDDDYVFKVQDAEIERDYAQKKMANNNERYLKSRASFGTAETYTSNYKEAIKQGTGWKAYWDDSPDADNPIAKSDVFTIDPATGMPLGVMTRSQRRAWDRKHHQATAQAKLNEDKKAFMEDRDYSATDTQLIHSDQGLETVIGADGVESKGPSMTKDQADKLFKGSKKKKDEDDE